MTMRRFIVRIAALLMVLLVLALYLGDRRWLVGAFHRAPEGEPLVEYDVAAMREDPFVLALALRQRFGAVEVAWPFAPVEVSASGRTLSLRADAEGRLALELRDLWKQLGAPASAVELDVRTAWRERAVHPSTRYLLDGAAIARRAAAHSSTSSAAPGRRRVRGAGARRLSSIARSPSSAPTTRTPGRASRAPPPPPANASTRSSRIARR
jgi:hypothetical protein